MDCLPFPSSKRENPRDRLSITIADCHKWLGVVGWSLYIFGEVNSVTSREQIHEKIKKATRRGDASFIVVLRLRAKRMCSVQSREWSE